MGAAFLPVHGAGKVASVRVHPVVVFNACDSYVRRQETQERVIGTLLGTVRHDGVVEIKNSYAVPHNEQNGQVYVDVEFHRALTTTFRFRGPAAVVRAVFNSLDTDGDGVIGFDELFEFVRGRRHSLDKRGRKAVGGLRLRKTSMRSSDCKWPVGESPDGAESHRIAARLVQRQYRTETKSRENNGLPQAWIYSRRLRCTVDPGTE